MFKLIFRTLAAAMFFAGASVFATETVERAELANHFSAAGVSGTFALYDIAADRISVHDRKRANQRFAPQSTFKIFNAMIGMDTGAVQDELEVLPYGGKPQLIKEWERDMNLRDGIRISNVPVYQELARRIGARRMQHYIDLVGYGNRKLGTVIDRFWLDGPLEISAIEQARLMARLAQRQLPFSERSMLTMRSMIQQEGTQGYTMFAKTGWGFHSATAQIGWLVGWIEKEGKPYAFALNIDILDNADAAKRHALVRDCLKTLLF
ncbi:class D beta-lactamase [Noviherbaspirillum sp. CPCC 100848]|uniref:beta-lactamase n=1 Tax=Noviherbaspirillum album TaxID=3080276 RepID=A0ABU6J8Q5_9BURK|nr:class D beta-lactamase [Noviherbaspirillum sp. CPCC 100848]MEC4720019.1 class D beta-lactamase [Noviherbaspirillum sp. CPCC 100848]